MKEQNATYIDEVVVHSVGLVTYKAEISEAEHTVYHYYSECFFVGNFSRDVAGYDGKINLDEPSMAFFNTLEGSLRCESYYPETISLDSNGNIDPTTPEFVKARKSFFVFLGEVISLYGTRR